MRPILALVLALSACATPEVEHPQDAALVPHDGPFFLRDTFDPDAWIERDGGPAVIPQQSWDIALAISPAANLSVTLEARAESGSVRAVVGGGGASRTIVLDIGESGRLIAREDVQVGATEGAACSRGVYTIQQMLLVFDDTDGDGIHETLSQVRAPTVLFDDLRGAGPQGAMRGQDLAMTIARDTTPPTVALDTMPFLPGLPIVVHASEPMSPGLSMQLVGARTVPLHADPGASAAATWRAPTWDLPAGHYDLAFAGAADDLVGLTAAALPTFAFDLADLVLLDALHPTLSVRTTTPIRAIGSLPGEVPFGAPDATYLASAPVVMAFDVGTHGPTQIQMVFRAYSDGAAMANPSFLLFGTDGSVTSYDGASFFRASTSVSGYGYETDTLSLAMTMPMAPVGRAYFAIVPAGLGALGGCGASTEGNVAVAFTRPMLL